LPAARLQRQAKWIAARIRLHGDEDNGYRIQCRYKPRPDHAADMIGAGAAGAERNRGERSTLAGDLQFRTLAPRPYGNGENLG
jgi:hypothetical protein